MKQTIHPDTRRLLADDLVVVVVVVGGWDEGRITAILHRGISSFPPSPVQSSQVQSKVAHPQPTHDGTTMAGSASYR